MADAPWFMPKRPAASDMILAALLGLQFLTAWFTQDRSSGLAGDETHYVRIASTISRGGSFPRPEPGDRLTRDVAEIGRWNDFRPPGFPVILAAIGVDSAALPASRSRVLGVSFAAASLCLFVILRGAGGDEWSRRIVAVILGAQPWLFEWSGTFYSDSLNASIFFLGSAGLIWASWSEDRRRRLLLAAVAAGLLGVSVLLRPEMFLFSLLASLLCLLLAGRALRRVARGPAVLALVATIAAMAGLSGHRFWYEGVAWPQLLPATPGLDAWFRTFPALEQEQCDLAWAIRDGQKGFDDLPERAFSSDYERGQIHAALARAESDGVYTRDTDNVFATVAASRRERWFRSVLLPRAWFSVHLWVNTNTASHVLSALSGVPRSVRRPILGGLLVAKLLILCSPVVLLLREGNWLLQPVGPGVWMAWMALVMVTSRTLLIGIVQGLGEHRLVHQAWPFMLALLALTVSSFARSRIVAPNPPADVSTDLNRRASASRS